MALWRAVAWFYIFVMVTFVVFWSPFVHTLTPCFPGGRKLIEGTPLTQTNPGRKAWKGDLGLGVEHSAREVPTGPDPLHHNDNPLRP